MHDPSDPDPTGLRADLLLEAIDLLVGELSTLASERWDQLPDLKKRKVVLASRLRQLQTEAGAADGGPADAIELLIADLDDQSQRKIQARLDLIGKQIVALQDLHLYWLECLHISFRMFTKRPLGNDGSMV